jgi:acyl carrier protein
MADSTSRKDIILAAIKTIRPDIDVSSLTDDTRLIRGLGCASIDGVDLAAELEAALGVVVPYEQNPFVREDGGRKRDRTLAELVSWTETLAITSATGGASA